MAGTLHFSTKPAREMTITKIQMNFRKYDNAVGVVVEGG
jgi:hypothetical protein